jgi:hypothetical protein
MAGGLAFIFDWIGELAFSILSTKNMGETAMAL